jgi:hypothetical protein
MAHQSCSKTAVTTTTTTTVIALARLKEKPLVSQFT